jgi:hypothetical protein
VIYVDEPIWRFKNMHMCHMIADNVIELHDFAMALGLKRTWFQDSPPASFPHYDVAKGMSERAVLMGAKRVGRKEIVDIIRRIRAARKELST